MPPLLDVFFLILIMGLIQHYTYKTSSDEPWSKRTFRFLGLVAASIPLIGFVEMAVFRESDYEYGKGCARITGVSLIWFGLSKLWHVFQ